MKRVLSVLLAVALLLTAIPAAFAVGAVTEGEFFTVDMVWNGTDTYDVTIHFATEECLSNGIFEVQFDPAALSLASKPSTELKNGEINIAERNYGRILIGFMNPATRQDIEDAIEFGGSEDDVFPKTGYVIRMQMKVLDESLKTTEITIKANELVSLNGECADIAPAVTSDVQLHFHTYDHDCDPDCNSCGEEREVSHHSVIDSAVAPTCTQSGWTEGAHCDRCGEVLVAQEEIPATGHTHTNDFDATCNICGAVREPLKLYGDVDGNGHVDSTDARLTLQYAVEKISGETLDLACADVDGSDKVDSTDARLILQYAVQKISTFPAQENL